MPQEAFSMVLLAEPSIVKTCPPFSAVLTCGFLMPLIADLRVEDGIFTWDALTDFSRSPIDVHDDEASGTPFLDEDRFIVKFANYWTLEVPPGYSLLITHPVNRHDLPFVTLTALVDADRYKDNFIGFPVHWRDCGFSGLLPKGTPVAQCIPVRRDSWTARFAAR